MHKELTELQARFLDALFGPAKGNQAKAMKMAGYSENTNPHHIVSSLRSEIIERAELEMAHQLLVTEKDWLHHNKYLIEWDYQK